MTPRLGKKECHVRAPFLIVAAAAAFPASASFTDQGPPPPRPTSERLLVASSRNGDRPDFWTVDEFLIRPDGSRRFLSRFTVDGDAWSDAGTMQYAAYMVFMEDEAAAAIQTPAQKKKTLLDAGVTSCCGQPDPVCDNFCGCIINVEQLPSGAAGASSSWCKCADEEPSGDCPDDWPNGYS